MKSNRRIWKIAAWYIESFATSLTLSIALISFPCYHCIFRNNLQDQLLSLNIQWGGKYRTVLKLVWQLKTPQKKGNELSLNKIPCPRCFISVPSSVNSDVSNRGEQPCEMTLRNSRSFHSHPTVPLINSLITGVRVGGEEKFCSSCTLGTVSDWL